MAETTSKPKAPILAGIDQITIIEGNTTQVFYIARNLLESEVPDFLATLNPTKSDKPLIAEIANVEIQTFSTFVRWLTARPRDPNPLLFEVGTFDWSTLLQMFQLCYFYYKTELRTLHVEMCTLLVGYMLKHARTRNLEARPRFIFAEHDAESVSVLINLICDRFPPPSWLYNYFVVEFCYSEKRSLSTRDRLLQYPKSFLADVMLEKDDLENTAYGTKRKRSR